MMNASEEKDVELQKLLIEEDTTSKRSPPTNKAEYVSRVKAFTSCVIYSASSCSMVLVNKSLASSFNHFLEEGTNLNILLVVFQAVITLLAVIFSKNFGWIEVPKFDKSVATKWAPINICFCLMLFTGMASLQHNSVPMVSIFKNLTNILITIGDYYFFGKSAELLVWLAFGIMLAGAVFAAREDISITFIGMFWMAMNCLSTAGYILYMKHATNTIKLSKFGMIFYNNLLCTFFLFPCTIWNGQLDRFLQTEALHTFDYAWKNVFAGLIGFLLNFASLNCVENTGPTTYAIVGSLTKIPITLLGWYLFKSVITPETWFFIGISMTGGFLYSYAKIKSAKEQEKGQVENK